MIALVVRPDARPPWAVIWMPDWRLNRTMASRSGYAGMSKLAAGLPLAAAGAAIVVTLMAVIARSAAAITACLPAPEVHCHARCASRPVRRRRTASSCRSMAPFRAQIFRKVRNSTVAIRSQIPIGILDFRGKIGSGYRSLGRPRLRAEIGPQLRPWRRMEETDPFAALLAGNLTVHPAAAAVIVSKAPGRPPACEREHRYRF